MIACKHRIYTFSIKLILILSDGLKLKQSELDQILKLDHKIAELAIVFEKNIVDDSRCITLSKQELTGCDEDFIEHLTQLPDGRYKVLY